MTRRGWALFSLVGSIWGVPYLFMKVAVKEIDTTVIVFSRLVIGASLLLPIALWQGSLRPAFKYLKYIFFYCLLEMVGPWYLITSSQRDLSSGVVALLVATVPIWATLFAHHTGDTTAAHRTRIFGITVGLIGILMIVGLESVSEIRNIVSLLKVLLASVLYAWAMNMVSRKVKDVSGVAINALAMIMAALVCLPLAILNWPASAPSHQAIFATVGLGILCTGLAFWVYFLVLNEVGPARASLVVYPNTAVAVLLGIIILNEPLTLAIIIGLPLVLIGSYFASRKTPSTQVA